MKFVVEREIFDQLPNLCFGIVVVRGVDNSKEYPFIDDFLNTLVN